MLKAYFDDSGSHASAANYIVAGYVATSQRWIDFESEWRAVLDCPPSIAYFKAQEANSRSGQFKDWDDTAVESKVRQLAAVIRRHVAYELSVVIPRKSFDAFLSALPTNGLASHPRAKKWKDPYFLCFQHLSALLIGFASTIMRDWDGLIDIVLDEQANVAGSIVAAWGKISRVPGYKLGMLAFGSDNVFVPLQAADFIAWGLGRFYSLGEIRPGWEEVLALPALRVRANDEQMRRYVDRLKEFGEP